MQYELLVDKYTRQARRQPKYELKTFYGQLQHIYAIRLPGPCEDLRLEAPVTVILATIRNCVVDKADAYGHGLSGNLDIRYYSNDGAIDVVDVTSVQCLVGRIRDRNKWAIIDRSGPLARALYVENESM